MAISHTSCMRRGVSPNKELCALLELPCFVQRETILGWYLLGIFTWPAYKNSFQGALPPTWLVWASCMQVPPLPDLDGLASTAIWTNCQVGNDNDSDCPTPSNCSAASTHFSISSLLGEASLAGDGWWTGEGGLLPFSARIILTVLDLNTLLLPALSPFCRS